MNAQTKEAISGEVVVHEAAPPVVHMSESGAFINMIERVVSDPNANIDKLERVVALYEKMEAIKKRAAFNEAMAACQAELPQVVRDAENTHTRSQYATLEAIGHAVDPIITKHGFSLSFGTAESPIPGCLRITCRTANKGHEQLDHADIPTDAAGSQGKVNKNATQAFKSTMTYGRVILTMLIFNVKSRKAMPDDDGNSASKAGERPTISEEQFMILRELFETDEDVKKFLAFAKIEGLRDIYADQFDEVARLVKQRNAAKAEKTKRQ